MHESMFTMMVFFAFVINLEFLIFTEMTLQLGLNTSILLITFYGYTLYKMGTEKQVENERGKK